MNLTFEQIGAARSRPPASSAPITPHSRPRLGSDSVETGHQTKRRNARQRDPVIAESEPLVLTRHRQALRQASGRPWRSPPPRRSRRSAASCSRPRPARPAKHGRPAPARNAARASARRSPSPTTERGSRRSRRYCARGSAGLERPRSSSRGSRSVEELRKLSTAQLGLMVGLGYAARIRAIVDDGDDAFRLEVERWAPKARAAVARALAEVG